MRSTSGLPSRCPNVDWVDTNTEPVQPWMEAIIKPVGVPSTRNSWIDRPKAAGAVTLPPSVSRCVYSTCASSAMLVGPIRRMEDLGRHDRHESAGMRLVIAASWWRSTCANQWPMYYGWPGNKPTDTNGGSRFAWRLHCHTLMVHNENSQGAKALIYKSLG